jgi:hypothetical protein
MATETPAAKDKNMNGLPQSMPKTADSSPVVLPEAGRPGDRNGARPHQSERRF